MHIYTYLYTFMFFYQKTSLNLIFSNVTLIVSTYNKKGKP